MFSIIYFFSIISVVIAFNISVYSAAHYYQKTNRTPLRTFEDKYTFEYNLNNILMMDVRLKNMAPGLKASVHITQSPLSWGKSGDTRRKNMTVCNSGPCLSLNRVIFNTSTTDIGLQLERGSTVCGTVIFMEGNVTYNTKKVPDLCVTDQNYCVIEIDVQNAYCNETTSTVTATDGSTSLSPSSPSSSSSSWLEDSPPAFSVTYVVLCVIGLICVLALAVCLCVKKYNLRKKNLPEPKSNDPSKEIIYADLGFAQEDPRSTDNHPKLKKVEEESPYAEIIGVLKRS